MKTFENGVAYYTRAKTELTVYFPEDVVRCQYCDFCRAEKDVDRWWCRLTHNMIHNPYANGLPKHCPLEIVKGEVYG